MLLYKCRKIETIFENTTYRLGGGVRVAYYPKNLYEAATLYESLISQNQKFVVLGNGSNILASDNFFDGVVISTKKLKGIVRVDKNTIFCLSGTSVGELLVYLKKHNLGGLEYLYGIPASIGGLCYMNGGAGGNYLSDNVKSVKLCLGKIINLPNKKCHFGNKYSTMRDTNSLILGVYLSVVPSSRAEIESKIEFYKSARAHLPKGRSCGCVFKNTDNIPSGKVIESLGLKGKRIGGAYVSNIHANFILCDGQSSSDVKSLIDFIKSKALSELGITLTEEVIYIGDFE
jgi:UDP-N-acetylmuramate dehydrogenase